MSRIGFCLMIDTVFEGTVPSLLGEDSKAWVFATQVEAEREIAELAITRLQEFLDGERDFDDAMTVEEYVVEVTILENGIAVDGHGRRFACCIADPQDDSGNPDKTATDPAP